MSNYKLFKDPLYGYIKIPKNYIDDVIDTSEFQRLRRISQTSYAPLYSSAFHNRFVHSIGVYYLGVIASKQLEAEISRLNLINNAELPRYTEVFNTACLLHDIGHAPFSHTGENFYIENNDYTKLHEILAKKIGQSSFNEYIKNIDKKAAPHEIMSAIIGIDIFASLLNNSDEKEFFARCITGYKYSNNSIASQLKNCYISLLNSKIIDVDKLDYLIRDAYITGYETVKIDYIRLLSALTIIKIDDHYKIVFKKSAISVIENVIYAHDAERKWIQSHPVVLYECYIIKHIIKKLIDILGNNLLSISSLSKTGAILNNNEKVFLLSDDDIIHFLKTKCDDTFSKEYFERKARRHPIWKSEAEYKAFLCSYVGPDSQIYSKLENALKQTAIYLNRMSNLHAINDETIANLKKDIQDLKNSQMESGKKSKILLEKNIILKIMEALKEYANELGIECDYVLLEASQFSSSFRKPDFAKLCIMFEEETFLFEKVVSSLSGKESINEDYFYLFYKRNDKDNKIKISSKELCEKLVKTVM